VMTVYQNFASQDPSKVIRYLKRLIKRPSADFAPTIAFVLKLAQDFEDNVGVCTWICHCLSNYALDESQAVHIVEKGGWKVVSEMLIRFVSNENLCWKACSAIWNLSRPVATHAFIDSKVLPYIFYLMDQHQSNSQVVYCCVGALGNLVIAAPEKIFPILIQKIPLLLEVIQRIEKEQTQNRFVKQVCTLFANMAVDHHTGRMLLSNNVLTWLMKMIENKDPETHSNILAAIHNLSDLPLFDHKLFQMENSLQD